MQFRKMQSEELQATGRKPVRGKLAGQDDLGCGFHTDGRLLEVFPATPCTHWGGALVWPLWATHRTAVQAVTPSAAS